MKKKKKKYKILHIPTGLYLTFYWFGFQLGTDGASSEDKKYSKEMIKRAAISGVGYVNNEGYEGKLLSVEESEFLLIEVDSSVDKFIKHEVYPGG